MIQSIQKGLSSKVTRISCSQTHRERGTGQHDGGNIPRVPHVAVISIFVRPRSRSGSTKSCSPHLPSHAWRYTLIAWAEATPSTSTEVACSLKSVLCLWLQETTVRNLKLLLGLQESLLCL